MVSRCSEDIQGFLEGYGKCCDGDRSSAESSHSRYQRYNVHGLALPMLPQKGNPIRLLCSRIPSVKTCVIYC